MITCRGPTCLQPLQQPADGHRLLNSHVHCILGCHQKCMKPPLSHCTYVGELFRGWPAEVQHVQSSRPESAASGRVHRIWLLLQGACKDMDTWMKHTLHANLDALVALALIVVLLVGTLTLAGFLTVRIGQFLCLCPHHLHNRVAFVWSLLMAKPLRSGSRHGSRNMSIQPGMCT